MILPPWIAVRMFLVAAMFVSGLPSMTTKTADLPTSTLP
jgi:hypothetical protein